MSEKISVAPIGLAHLASFRGYSRQSVVYDILTFLLLPLAVGFTVAKWAPPVVNAVGVLAGVAVFTALLFGLLINILNLSIKLRRDEGLRPESKLVRNVDEVFANVAWTTVVGLLLVVLLVLGSATQVPGQALPGWYGGVLAGVFLHVVLSVLMSVVRLFSAHQQIAELSPKRAEQPNLRALDPPRTG